MVAVGIGNVTIWVAVEAIYCTLTVLRVILKPIQDKDSTFVTFSQAMTELHGAFHWIAYENKLLQQIYFRDVVLNVTPRPCF